MCVGKSGKNYEDMDVLAFYQQKLLKNTKHFGISRSTSRYLLHFTSMQLITDTDNRNCTSRGPALSNRNDLVGKSLSIYTCANSKNYSRILSHNFLASDVTNRKDWRRCRRSLIHLAFDAINGNIRRPT